MGLFSREGKKPVSSAQPAKSTTAPQGPHAGSFDCGCGAQFHTKQELQAHARQYHPK